MTMANQQMRLRVVSCQRVIHDVSALLSRQRGHQRIVDQLNRLDELLALIDHRVVTEGDLFRIETATNQLMSELGSLFSHQKMGVLYEGSSH